MDVLEADDIVVCYDLARNSDTPSDVLDNRVSLVAYRYWSRQVLERISKNAQT